MSFCFHCGRELPEGSGFCPACGHSVAGYQYPPVQAEPLKPKLDGSVKGKSIAAVILGGEGLGMGFASLIYAMVEGIVFLAMQLSAEASEVAPLSIMFYLYVFIFAMICLGSCIAARILAGKALEKNPDFKLAKAGSILGIAGIILSASVLVLGLFPLLGLL